MTWLNFHCLEKHLLIDATVASIYTWPQCSSPEAHEFSLTSRAYVAGIIHRLVPLAAEESGLFGDHSSLRLLREIATRGVDDGFLLPPSSWLSFKKARLVKDR